MSITWNMRLRQIIEDGLNEGLKPKAIAEKHGLRVEIIYTYIHRHGLAFGYKNAELRKKKPKKDVKKTVKKNEIHCHQCGFGNLENKSCYNCWYFKLYNGFRL